MSVLKVRCPCGQMMQVREEHAGGLCRCPNCGQQLRVPPRTQAVSNAADFAQARQNDDPFADIGPTSFNAPTMSTGHVAPPQKAKSNVAVLLLVLGGVFGFGVLGCGVLSAWVLLRTSVEEVEPIAGKFEALDEPTGSIPRSNPGSSTRSESIQNAAVSSDPVLQIAQQFADYSAVPNSADAIGLIDKNLFRQRVRGPNGSAQATTKAIEVEKLLSNFHRVSFEGTPGNGALRHWSVLGKTRFDGQDAVLLRYYSEVIPPAKWISQDELLNSLIPLISFEEYWEATSCLQALSPGTQGKFGNAVPQKPDSNGLLFPRAGYVLLCFEQVNGQPTVSDLASAISQLRLSRASGELYLRDWQVITFGPGKGPESASEPITATIYGELPVGMTNEQRSFDSMADFRHYVDPNRKASNQVAALPLDQQNNRTYRLKDIAAHVRVGSPKLRDRLEQFRTDFPGDFGADMVAACLPMVKQSFELAPGIEEAVKDSAKRIYVQFKDPFMLYTQWMVAKFQGNREEVERLLTELESVGFETAEMHRYRLGEGIQSADAAEVRSVLNDLANYWDPKGQLPKQTMNSAIQSRWAYLADQIRLASNESSTAGPSRRGPFGPVSGGPGRRGPSQGTRGPSGSGSRNPSASGGPGSRPSGRGAGPTAGFGTGGARRPPSPGWTASAENTVTVAINANTSFDVNAYAKELQAKLQCRTYRAARSNNQGTITLEYSGTLDAVVQAIDFGAAEVDRSNARRVTVKLDN